MNKIAKHPLKKLGYDFIDPQWLPDGKDEYYLRSEQQHRRYEFRRLTSSEVEVLVKNENTADNWDTIYVTERFNPELVKRCQFCGLVRIGALDSLYLEFHDLRLPVGLRNSTIVSCDIGSNVVIDNVCYLAHYIIGDEVILLNIDEMLTTNHAKFGNGIVKEGEPESVRIRLDIVNENGGRGIVPFDGLLPADAYMWSKYRNDAELMARLVALTDARYDQRRGFYGEVGDRTIVKDCGILKDVKIGSDAYIKGANKLKNLTINSDAEESSQIGEGVELVNGIIGYGCRIFYGVKAVRFVMGPNSALKYGARLIHSMLGDNSTISCCEVLNSLIFPGHEQHHNNSFLCAAVVLGQSNMAAGVTAGSNHNSRANDGEIRAGRGFWPGLCTSLKHCSRFASFTLLAKGTYPAELNIHLPFCLVANDEANGSLRVMPAYWFLHNLYALARNAWKYGARDKRVHKQQMIEFDALAPDTIEEIFAALEHLEIWTAKAALRREGKPADGVTNEMLRKQGRELLWKSPETVAELEIVGENMENTRRPVRILRTEAAYLCYRDVVHYYGVRTLVAFMLESNISNLAALRQRLGPPQRGQWVNLGGQLMCREDVQALRNKIVSGELNSWDAVHDEYRRLWEKYPEDKARHALASLLEINEIPIERLDRETWFSFLDRAVVIRKDMAEKTAASRAKDYTAPFRQITFESREEMDAVLGTIEDNDFIKQTRAEAETFSRNIEGLKQREQG
ncbi:MAG TPA: DUF4954 family protein [Phycisphaerae bacterium]|nr:DUF4954 family protein [Phycisphaerae bacterium]